MTPRDVAGFLAELEQRLRGNAAHRAQVIAEIADHLADLVSEARADGCDQAAAEARAVARFGSARRLARGLGRRSRARWATRIALALGALGICGGFVYVQLRAAAPVVGVYVSNDQRYAGAQPAATAPSAGTAAAALTGLSAVPETQQADLSGAQRAGVDSLASAVGVDAGSLLTRTLASRLGSDGKGSLSVFVHGGSECITAVVGNMTGGSCMPSFDAAHPVDVEISRAQDGSAAVYGLRPDAVTGVSIHLGDGSTVKPLLGPNYYYADLPSRSTAVLGLAVTFNDGTRTTIPWDRPGADPTR